MGFIGSHYSEPDQPNLESVTTKRVGDIVSDHHVVVTKLIMRQKVDWKTRQMVTKYLNVTFLR